MSNLHPIRPSYRSDMLWPLRPTCEERGCSCHPDDDSEAFEQWKDNGMCRRCNDLGYNEYMSDLRALAR